jgi:putative endopeptidase
MKLKLTGLAAIVAISACSPAPQSSDKETATPMEKTVPLSSGIMQENMDLSVKPGDDFFNYVNGKWLEKTEIPADKSSYGGFAILRDEAQADVMAIINASAEGDFTQGTDEQKVGGLYRTGC